MQPCCGRCDLSIRLKRKIYSRLCCSARIYLGSAISSDVSYDWENRRQDFTPYISEAVINEVALGDREIASERLALLQGFPLLELTQAVRDLGMTFLKQSNLPPKANIDAIHIGAATIHNMNYLLTWNCKHIANPQIQQKLREISLNFGYQLPVICTPYELLGE